MDNSWGDLVGEQTASPQNPWTDLLGSGQDQQQTILPQPTQVTQHFGNKNPMEVFSGGIALGTNLRAPIGTSVAVPPGSWKVVQVFTNATKGYIGDDENKGYGNSVMVENADTGEKLHFTHLSQVDVKPGETLSGGVVGKTGATGNVTGPHLNLEYYHAQGRLGDVLQSPYAQYVPLTAGE